MAETPPGDHQQHVAKDDAINLVHGPFVQDALANDGFAVSGKYGVAVAAADVKVTHAPCEGGVITGRPTRTFSPPPPLPMA